MTDAHGTISLVNYLDVVEFFTVYTFQSADPVAHISSLFFLLVSLHMILSPLYCVWTRGLFTFKGNFAVNPGSPNLNFQFIARFGPNKNGEKLIICFGRSTWTCSEPSATL